MYLRKLEMRGFKTFADHTELEFGPGLTAIVGPNGVGKSNISDAILWSLGEQSNRTLRTNSSEDVIFAGSENRRRLGMAEVGLTLDNSNNTLNVDFSEVTISRRLFRSGDSEYLINHSICRLRDIKEMLLDTGVGPDTYSIIGQGEIDAILSIRSEDRRELLEEVAGTRKYRIRRDEATRKLEATEANVTRVADILAELKTQREPLEKEAEVAREYKELSAELADIERKVLACDYRRAHKRLGKLTNDLHIAQADAQGTKDKLSTLDAEVEKLQLRLAQRDDDLEGLRHEALQAQRKVDQARQAQSLAQERLRSARSRKEDLNNAVERHKQRVTELTEQLQQATAERDDITRKLQQAESERDELAQQLQEINTRFEDDSQKISQLQQQRDEARRQASALENEASALDSLLDDTAQRVRRLSEQSENFAERELQLQESVKQAQQRRDELARELSEKRQELEKAREMMARANKGLQEHRRKCDLFSGAVTAAEAQQNLLQELDQSKEGFEDGVKTVLGAAADGDIAGVHGIVADLVDVPARFERAIEAALGGRLQWVVMETRQQATAAAAWARENDCPQVTFIALASVPPLSGSTIAQQVSGEGCHGPALKAVRTKREYNRLFEHLLERTVIVRDLQTAISLQGRFRSRMRIATLQGDVIHADGAITVGGARESGAGAFGRRRELDELTNRLDTMRQYLAAMWEKEEQLEEWTHGLSEKIEGLESEVASVRSDHAAIESDVAHLQDQKKAAQKAQTELSQEAEALRERHENMQQRREKAQADAQKLQEQAQQVTEQLERMQTEGVGQTAIEQIRDRYVNAKVQAAELAEKQRSLHSLVERYERELQRARQEKAQAEQQLQQAAQTEAELAQQVGTPTDDLDQLEEEAKAAKERLDEAAAEVSILRQKSSTLEAAHKKLVELAQEQSDRIHRVELAIAREEGKLQNVVEKLADTYDMTPKQALEAADIESSRQQLGSKASRLRTKIRELGPVNITAIDECERLKAREQFLEGQLQDLQQAKQDLTEVIEEIDQVATEQFMECFDQLQEQFKRMFVRLFEGGDTELKLTNEENPLEGGVDVIVQVPGKRQQNLLLLSGGERALTAIALLFGMLRVKPTPFCVMDEIDAALDEANIDRFVDLLGDFTEDTQFIVVTHNPHTIQAADVLFGVTMEEQGVSQLIRLELREWEEFVEEAERQVQAVQARTGSSVGS